MADLGRIGYEAYARFRGGKAFDGRDMPKWEDLEERVRDAWRAAAGEPEIGYEAYARLWRAAGGEPEPIEPTEATRLETDFGRIGYEAYARFTDGKAFDGCDMPKWEDLEERIRDAWRAAADAIKLMG